MSLQWIIPAGASAKAINNLVASHRKLALLAGDLNADPGSETLRQFTSMWRNTASVPLATFPVAEPQRQIDFILCRPPDRWKVLEVQVLQHAVASDHRAIFARLELLQNDQ